MNYKTLLFIIEAVLIIFIGIPTVYATIAGVPFMPTSKRTIHKILERVKIKDGMTVYEPGCGDARFLTKISKIAKIKAIGFEFSPLVWILAKMKNFINRGRNVKVYYRNYNNHDYRDADIIFMFLLPKRVKTLTDKLKKECRKNTIIISAGFKIEDMEPYDIIEREKGDFTVYFYKI